MGSSSEVYWLIPPYLRRSNVRGGQLQATAEELHFDTFLLHPQNLDSRRRPHFEGATGTHARSAGARRPVTQTVPPRKAHRAGRERFFIYRHGSNQRPAPLSLPPRLRRPGRSGMGRPPRGSQGGTSPAFPMAEATPGHRGSQSAWRGRASPGAAAEPPRPPAVTAVTGGLEKPSPESSRARPPSSGSGQTAAPATPRLPEPAPAPRGGPGAAGGGPQRRVWAPGPRGPPRAGPARRVPPCR